MGSKAIGSRLRALGALLTLAALAILLACGAPAATEPPPTGPVGSGAAAQTLPVRTPEGTGGVNAPETLDKPYVVLVSFDGFRHDYLSRYDTPNFDRVAGTGAVADALIPVYPSLTFPSHYSIATGLYPEHHGIVGNRFFDPTRDEQYNYQNSSSVQDGTWYGGEPIWVTAETQGMVAAAMLFVGTEAAIGGVRPTFWTPYDNRGSRLERVDQVLAWLSMPDGERPHLITLYFSAVDGAGHDTGPATGAVEAAVGQVDAALGHLLDGIERLPHADQVSVVAVSDHGMGAVDPTRVVDLRDIATITGIRTVVTGTGANLFVGGDMVRARAVRDDINDQLRDGRAYLRAEVPDALHYRAHARIGDVVVVTEPGAMVGFGGRAPPTGMHGWDPRASDMHGIFLATGGEIAPGRRIGPVDSVHIYPFLAHLLRLTPNPDIDGDLSMLAALLDQ
ncbi:MAG: ectonucleotide pyrophosphatase/phosphodiesterase [Vicinamibacterales bacterium]|nr:ectonucleotide pyrophosphatase/phosphodiesterase [Vicinamibacterales bacterium]